MIKFMKLLLPISGIAAMVATITVGQDAPKPAFEVASIKPNTSADNRIGIGLQPGGRFTATGATLRLLVRQAFRVQDFQVSGGPAWAGVDRYDIEAKAPEGPITPNEIAPMIQSMLEERFKLKFHREMRELPVYELVVGRDGSKLQQSKDANGQPLVALPPRGAGPRGAPPAPGPPTPGSPVPQGSIRFLRGEVMASAIPVTQFATVLSQQLGRPVVDKTGITGLYDFRLEFTPEVGQGGGPFGPAGIAPAGPPPAADLTGPSIFTAVQEQLGLRLESTRAPVEVIVIDSAEKPTEN